MNGNAPYLSLEDNYDAELVLDDKHCTKTELRLMIAGHEFYLTPDTAAKLIGSMWPLADWGGK